MKKSYAKVLKEEGMDSSRVADRGKGKSGKLETASGTSGDGGNEDDLSDSDSEARTNGKGKSREKGKGRERARPSYYADLLKGITGAQEDAEMKEEEEEEVGPAPTAAGRTRALSPDPVLQAEIERQTKPEGTRAKGRVGASASAVKPKTTPAVKARPTIDAKNEAKISLREMKKQAFAKHHPRPAPTYPFARGPGTNGRVGGGGMRGQPNMGARMGVLLEQIKRDRQG